MHVIKCLSEWVCWINEAVWWIKLYSSKEQMMIFQNGKDFFSHILVFSVSFSIRDKFQLWEIRKFTHKASLTICGTCALGPHFCSHSWEDKDTGQVNQHSLNPGINQSQHLERTKKLSKLFYKKEGNIQILHLTHSCSQKHLLKCSRSEHELHQTDKIWTLSLLQGWRRRVSAAGFEKIFYHFFSAISIDTHWQTSF